MGASPIREALSLLVSDQLVVRHEQRGFQAAEIGPENFAEILSLRSLLEARALRQSMDNATDEWHESIVIMHHRLTRAQDAGTTQFEVDHKNFHMALINNCASPLLLRICDQLYDLNIRYRYIAGQSKYYRGRKIEDEHQNILDATLSGDQDAAVDALLLHYQKTGDFLKSRIDQMVAQTNGQKPGK